VSIQQIYPYQILINGDGATTTFSPIFVPSMGNVAPTGVWDVWAFYDDNTQNPSTVNIEAHAVLAGGVITVTFETPPPAARDLDSESGPKETNLTIYLLYGS
jgi:hypothetical protein